MTSVRRTSRALTQGFTLIEIMIATVVLGLILVMLAGAFHAVATSKLQGEDRIVTERQGRAIVWQLAASIRGAVATPTFPSRVFLLGTAHEGGARPLDSVTVSTLDLMHRPSLDGFGAEELVTYSTAPNPHHSGWSVLSIAQSSALLTDTSVSAPAVVIADNILSLHIRYFDGNLWNESWNSASLPPGRQLPFAVMIDLVLADEATAVPHYFSTSVTLPMAFAQW